MMTRTPAVLRPECRPAFYGKCNVNAQDLRSLLQTKPFYPFRLYMTEGSVYGILHPELLMVGQRTALIGQADDPNSVVFDRHTLVSLLHIVRTERLEPVSTN